MTRRLVRSLLADLDAVVERDPAARSRAEVALLYPGMHAIWAHRVSNRLWKRGAKLPARGLSQLARLATQIEIHPGATIGDRVFIDHGCGVVIGETAEVGSDVTIYHGVTLGGVSLEPGRRHPSIGDGVIIGAGAKVLGPIEVGDDSRIGANAVLVKSVAPESVVVGVPGQVVAARGVSKKEDKEPDPLAFAVRSLLRRVEKLEKRNDADAEDSPALYREDGVWEPIDYAI